MRLVVALSVAAVLAVFLIWTSLAGGTASLQPSQLGEAEGEVGLAGIVVGFVEGDAQELATCWRPGDEVVGGAAAEQPDRAEAVEQQRHQRQAARGRMLEERGGEDHGPTGRDDVGPASQQRGRRAAG